MGLRALLLLSVLIGCNSSYAALFDDEGARRQIATQQKQIGELRKQEKVLETRITELEETNNQALVGLHNQVEELRITLNKLNGQIEVLTNEIGLSQNRQKDFYIDLDSRLRRIEQPDASADTELNAKPSAATDGLPAKNVNSRTPFLSSKDFSRAIPNPNLYPVLTTGLVILIMPCVTSRAPLAHSKN